MFYQYLGEILSWFKSVFHQIQALGRGEFFILSFLPFFLLGAQSFSGEISVTLGL